MILQSELLSILDIFPDQNYLPLMENTLYILAVAALFVGFVAYFRRKVRKPVRDDDILRPFTPEERDALDNRVELYFTPKSRDE
ncbi:MAG: hypothetical protein HQL77_15185 [Magnetococcales bacterium]|nr:hypothetical protein [Magnetococcales bacterium]